jgi:hypothetical protein
MACSMQIRWDDCWVRACAASGPVGSRSADLGLGAVDAQLHAVGGQERPDLTDGAGDGGTVDPIEHRQLA